MKTKYQIVQDWLPRYTGRPRDQFGKYILLTNFANYVEMFATRFKVEVLGRDRPMQSATAENITIAKLSSFWRAGYFDKRKERTEIGGLMERFNVRPRNPRARFGNLSGGNQQKLLIGRELSGSPKVIVAVHPTRGVDIGATETIHRLLSDQRSRGAAILLISEDLDELMALSDRIAVLYNGRVVGTVDAARANRERIGLMMTGVDPLVSEAAALG